MRLWQFVSDIQFVSNIQCVSNTQCVSNIQCVSNTPYVPRYSTWTRVSPWPKFSGGGGRTKIFLKIVQFLCINGRCRLWGYFKSSEGCKKCVKMTNFLSSHAPYNCALHYFGSLWALRGPKMAPFSFYRPFKVHKNQKTRVHQKFGRCNCGWDEGLDQS